MRTAQITRNTKETQIELSLNLDGSGLHEIETGIGFFDHMLAALAVHAGFDLTVRCKGDLEVDTHHTVEDIGICLGQAFAQAVGDKKGIARYGHAYIPLDEAMCFCCVDISGRAYDVCSVETREERIGNFETATLSEFVRAFAVNAGITLHLKKEYGANGHHVVEVAFKALAHALKAAVRLQGDVLLSTKGVL